MHVAGPAPLTAMWYLAALAFAVTATLITRSPRQTQPIGLSYDLGWQQGYRTALATQLKGQFRGKDQSPPEG